MLSLASYLHCGILSASDDPLQYPSPCPCDKYSIRLRELVPPKSQPVLHNIRYIIQALVVVLSMRFVRLPNNMSVRSYDLFAIITVYATGMSLSQPLSSA